MDGSNLVSRRTTRSVSARVEPRRLVVDHVPHRTALHRDDPIVTVSAVRSGGQADHVARGRRAQYLLGRNSRNVVALVDDDLAVRARSSGGVLAAREALHHRNVDRPGRLALPRADRPDRRRIEIEELSQALHPLLGQRLAADENERRPAPSRNWANRDDRPADPGRRTKNPELVRKHRLRSLSLRAV